MTQPLLAPDVVPIIRKFMLAELSRRGHDVPWFAHDVPEAPYVPADRRFVVIDELNSRYPTDMAGLVVDVMIQIRVHDPDNRRARALAELINALLPTIARGQEIADTEHIGGPTEMPDPDVPGVRRWIVTAWVAIPCQPV